MIKIIKEVNFDRFDDDDYNLGDDWITSVPKECIKGITLLSEDEYEEYQEIIPPLSEYWWLRETSVFSPNVALVDSDGDTSETSETDDDSVSVRPVLILDSSLCDVDIGKTITIDKYTFTRISENYAICDTIIGYCCFRKNKKARDSEVYAKSDVKKFLDSWFTRFKKSYKGK